MNEGALHGATPGSPSAPLRVPIARLPHGADLPLPRYATEGASGLDLLAALAAERVIAPGECVAIPCGFSIAIPEGYEAQVRPRSGLALRCGLTIPNAPGTVDSDYRGEIQVLLLNAGRESVRIQRGDRIAQLVFAPVTRVTWQRVEQLAATARGRGGFGHTGWRDPRPGREQGEGEEPSV